MAKILLIEDDEALRDFLSAELQRIGHAVTVASSGRYVVHGIGKSDFGAVFDLTITNIRWSLKLVARKAPSGWFQGPAATES